MKNGSAAYFNSVAADWDRLRQGFFPQAVRERALALAGVCGCAGQGIIAADLGAGAGFITKGLLEAGCTVFAVDRSPAMLDQLRAAFAPAKASRRLTVLQGEAETLPLPAGSMDCAFANMLLHHVDDPARAIVEMARILKPGGRLVITDLDTHAHRQLLEEHHDRWPGFRRADVAEWLRAAGLEAVQVAASGENCCAAPGQAGACACSPGSPLVSEPSTAQGGEPILSAQTAPDGVSIFVASARKSVLGIRPADADAASAGQRARALFDGSPPLLCAESVFQAVAEALGVCSPLVPRVATGLCSGFSRTDGLCGAYTGGVLGLGLALGRSSGRDDLDATYLPVQLYREFFLERFGHLRCTGICGCRLDTDEGRRNFGPSGAKARCLSVVEAAAAQVLRLLQQG